MATYYIGTNGSASNAGTRAAPFASMAKVASRLQPGDVVYYLEGTYRNPTYGATTATGEREIWKDESDAVFKLNNVHGTATAPIIISAEPGAKVKFEFDSPTAITLRACSYIEVRGFEIEGAGTSITPQQAQDAQWTYRIATSEDANGNPVYTYYERDPMEVMSQTISSIINNYAALGIDQSGSGKPKFFQANGISAGNGSHHISIIDNIIHDCPSSAISAQVNVDYLTIRGNTLYNNTWYTSNGSHAITIKYLDSLDASDAFKIIIEDNYLYDNYNLLVSWVPTKVAVERKVDEGKAILIQESLATPNATTGTVWDHGRVLIANNIVERSGNGAISQNDARGITFLDNVFIDNGFINTLLAQDSDPTSEWFDFFSQQLMETGYRVATGGFRIGDGYDTVIDGNIVVLNDARLNAIDTAMDTAAPSVQAIDNLYFGGSGLRIRTEPGSIGTISSGFAQASSLVRATNGAQVTLAGAGNDIVLGNETANTLNGGIGNDQLIGHGGGDAFLISFQNGDDRILDFNPGFDKIQLATGQYRFDHLTILQSGRDTLIKTPDGIILLSGVTATSLTENDFIFVHFSADAASSKKQPPVLEVDPDTFDFGAAALAPALAPSRLELPPQAWTLTAQTDVAIPSSPDFDAETAHEITDHRYTADDTSSFWF